jgi:hypothetical protein
MPLSRKETTVNFLLVLGSIFIAGTLALFGLSLYEAFQPLRTVDNIRKAVQACLIDVISKITPQSKTDEHVAKLTAEFYKVIDNAIVTVEAAIVPATAKDVLYQLKRDAIAAVGAVGAPPKDGDETKKGVLKAVKAYNLPAAAPATIVPADEKRAKWYAALAICSGVLAGFMILPVSWRFSDTAARKAMENLITAFATYASFEAKAKDLEGKIVKQQRLILLAADEPIKRQMTEDLLRLQNEQKEVNSQADVAATQAKTALMEARAAYPTGEIDAMITQKWNDIQTQSKSRLGVPPDEKVNIFR